MADRTRQLDWKNTSVGRVEDWPDILLITVNLLLANQQPMFLMWGKDLIQFYNDAFRPSLGVDKHPRALGQRGQDCWPEIWDMIGPQIEDVMTHGKSCWFEDQLVPFYRNGALEDIYWTYSYSPVRAADGEICGTLVTCSETTRRIKLEQELRRDIALRMELEEQRSNLMRELQNERSRLLELLTQAPAFVAVLRGENHVFEFTNELYNELIGNRALLGKSVHEAIPEASGQGYFEVLDKVYRTGEAHVAYGSRIQLARKAGFPLETRVLDFVYQPIRDSNGSASGIIVLGIDVTARAKAERSLIQSEKLAAVGRLAASIAHEINNPLEAVTNLLYLVELTDDRKQRAAFLKTAQRELDRVAKITTQTLRFHRQSTNNRQLFLEEILESVIELSKARLRNARVTLIKDYRTRGEIIGRDGDLRQVFLNLLSNAIDACHGGGTISVRLREGIDFRSGQTGIRLLFSDTGTGMSLPVLERLFEPFFTTKEATGTGLGLWISKEILDHHQATIRIRSRVGGRARGTLFSIFFPADRPEQA